MASNNQAHYLFGARLIQRDHLLVYTCYRLVQERFVIFQSRLPESENGMRGKAHPSGQAGFDVYRICHDLLLSAKKSRAGKLVDRPAAPMC
jgi:hypothetical protein